MLKQKPFNINDALLETTNIVLFHLAHDHLVS